MVNGRAKAREAKNAQWHDVSTKVYQFFHWLSFLEWKMNPQKQIENIKISLRERFGILASFREKISRESKLKTF